MAAVGFEILLILLLLVANGVFAMAEITVVSARRARLQQRADTGDAGALAALELGEEPTRFLSTVQIGITLIGTLAGAFGGATIAEELARPLHGVEFLAPYADALALALVVAAIAYLSLVVGELVPKRIGLNDPERFASLLARPMRLLSRLTAPIVHLLTLSSDLVVRALGVRPSDEPLVTEHEVRTMLAQGTEAGVFDETEQDIVENVFRLSDRRISALMTPRTEATWLDLDDPPEANRKKIVASGHSRFPVYQQSLDNIQGMIEVKSLWAQSPDRPFDLRAALQRPLFLPESLPALRALDAFKKAGTEAALVIDEYGGIQGLVTLTDVLEAIVGDIQSPQRLLDPEIVRREDGSWLLDGLLPLDEFMDLFGIKGLTDEERTYQTLGGLVMSRLGRVPQAADHFEWNGLRLEVVDMDGHRVDKVLVTPAESSDAAARTADDES